MKIAFVQILGMGSAGGSFRIFENLLTGSGVEAASFVYGCERPTRPWAFPESFVPERPHFGRIEYTRFAPWLAHARLLRWRSSGQQLRESLSAWGPDHVHAHLHGNGFIHAMDWCAEQDVPLSLSVHDDIRHLTKGDPWAMFIERKAAEAWRKADNCFVISREIGEEYSSRYGARRWIQVTDGLDEMRTAPRPFVAGRLNIYFAGAVNVPYESNLKALQAALKMYKAKFPSVNTKIILRGGRNFSWEDTSAPRIEVREFGTPKDVQMDLTDADVLYLPLSIDKAYENFARFSLSTKLITYLGSGLPIFYHGPAEAAAHRLLQKAQACFPCFENVPDKICRVLEELPATRDTVVSNALKLGAENFAIESIRARFWTAIFAATPGGGPCRGTRQVASA